MNNNAPDRDTLKKLFDDMPGMVTDLEDQRALKGKRSAMLAKPSKLCNVCGKGFEFKMVVTDLPEMESCADCKALLDDHYIAFVSDNRYAFVKSSLPDVVNWAGKIVQIPPQVMDRLELKFTAAKVQQKPIQLFPANGTDTDAAT